MQSNTIQFMTDQTNQYISYHKDRTRWGLVSGLFAGGAYGCLKMSLASLTLIDTAPVPIMLWSFGFMGLGVLAANYSTSAGGHMMDCHYSIKQMEWERRTVNNSKS